MERDLWIMHMPKEDLPGTWERYTDTTILVKTLAEDELEKPRLANAGSYRWSTTHILIGYC